MRKSCFKNCDSLVKHYSDKIIAEFKDIVDTNAGILEFYIERLFLDGQWVEVVAEYDQNHPCCGIYYGLRAKSEIDDKLDGIKRKFLDENGETLPSEPSSKKIFLPDDPGNSEDGTKWLFWIRLEDYRPISFAITACHKLVSILKSLGYK